MEKTLRQITIFLICVLILLVTVSLIQKTGRIPAPKKPLPQAKQWYLVNTVRNQVSTAYTEPVGAPVSASARPYFIGGVAVHPRVPGGSHLEPVIPFGTVIHLIKPNALTIQGKTMNTFVVTDTGDADWALWPSSPYWVDFYYGTGNYWNNLAASNYGKNSIDYYWYEPIR
ncbi:MAG: hypothetical protein ACM3MK_08040 [Chitinophagales bacterium]